MDDHMNCDHNMEDELLANIKDEDDPFSVDESDIDESNISDFVKVEMHVEEGQSPQQGQSSRQGRSSQKMERPKQS